MYLNLHEDLVSIIIPVYNSEKFLAETIESALAQTYKNIEIIAVDDGSTDLSLEILLRYDDKLKIISQRNEGLASSFNKGIENIKGKWVKWLSPDDVLYPEAIETLITEARKFHENVILYSNWDLIDKDSKKIRSFKESNYNNLTNFEFNVRLLDGQQINVNTTLIPSQLFKQGCCMVENLEDSVVIDYEFFLRAALLYDVKFYLISRSLIKYRIHSGQMSHVDIASSLKHLVQVRNQVLNKLKKSKREEYLNALSLYGKRKSLPRKSMEFSLKLATIVLPRQITNKILLFYLNKIRRSR